MTEPARLKILRIALVLVGLTFTFGFYPLILVWPSGWAWHAEGRSYYLEMLMSIYATLGIFLMLAARNPAQNRSLIWFTIWSSVVHGGVMAVQALEGGGHHMGHLYGDVPALILTAAALAWLMPPKSKGDTH